MDPPPDAVEDTEFERSRPKGPVDEPDFDEEFELIEADLSMSIFWWQVSVSG